MHRFTRDYDTIASQLVASGPIQVRQRRVVDALWAALSDQGVSWVGFYIDQPDEPDDRRLVLGPHRDRPACSPIGLHGACGQCLRSGQPIVVDDVASLGAGYIACDPRDRSEVVIPLIKEPGGTEPAGECWAVLDLDSHDVCAFGERDVVGLGKVLRVAGLAEPGGPPSRLTGERGR